jgi:GAF domain-containing protein
MTTPHCPSPSSDRENARLAALARYHILDTPPEREFDALAQLAGLILEAPISVINLIDRDRQWFKSEIGIGTRELPLDVSICRHAILQKGLFVVPDTTQDDRFKCNPLVTGTPHLRFYAGALLETGEGLPLGTLCVLDYRPRSITEAQGRALELLASQVMSLFELRLASRQLALRNQELEEARVQIKTLEGILPICAQCKKIRDDKNDWQPIESYLVSRAEVSFTHGLCPTCHGAYLAELGRLKGRLK